MSNDILALVFSYVYASSLLVVSEILMRKFGWKQFITRKLVHIGAGMWVWGILYFFDTWYLGIIPFATFIILNFIIYKYEILKGVDAEDSSPGTVYFAFSITALFLLFWRTGVPSPNLFIAVAAVMAMTWGDALASLVGKTWGKRKYTFLKHTRTWEGSAAMFISAFIVIFLVLKFLPGSGLNPGVTSLSTEQIFILTGASAGVGTFAESISPAGTDNLSVPFAVALILWLLT